MKQQHSKILSGKFKHPKEKKTISSSYFFALKSFRFGQPLHISELIHFIIGRTGRNSGETSRSTRR